jgi:CheY-like chemotaxis protein
VAHSIVARHGGILTVRSQPGEGTCFEFFLPASTRPASSQSPCIAPPASVRGRILFMDDEPAIGRVAQNGLTRLGFTVTLVTHGEAAVDQYRCAIESGQPFAAVVLDLTIPGGIGGVDTLRRLRLLDPSVRALASSGYSDDPVMAEFARYGFRAAAAKPYRIQELADHLQRVLNAN